MRPVYETSEDRHAEAVVMFDVQRIHKVGTRRIRKFFPVDYVIVDGPHVTKWVEVKCRNYTLQELNHNGGLFLSALKIANIDALVRATGVAACVVAGLRDGVYVADLPSPNNASLAIVLGGRTDRDDPADVEPCVCVPPWSWVPVADYDRFRAGQRSEATLAP